MALDSQGFVGALFLLLAACRSAPARGPETGGATAGETAGETAAKPETNPSAAPVASAQRGCSQPEWATSTAADPSGRPQAILRHPAAWQVVVLAPGRLQFNPPSGDFQVIVSALKGPSQTDEQVRQLSEQSLGQMPVVSPWRQVDARPEFRSFTVTHRSSETDFEVHYYAGAGGLVVLSIESAGPLVSAVASQWQSLLACLSVSFT